MNDSTTRRFGWPAVLALLAVAALIVAIVLTERSRGRVTGTDAVTGAYGQPRDTIDMRTIGYARGPEDAPITVYEFSDFGCPYCAKFALETYPELHREFVATGKVRWAFVPFVMGSFPNGGEATKAAECAGEQDRFWVMHDRLFERQREWKRSGDADALFGQYARELDLDAERFASCYREDRRRDRLAVSNYVADALRIRGTPSFFINGQLVAGALPIEAFREILTSLSAE